jgi:hypothetical protein
MHWETKTSRDSLYCDMEPSLQYLRGMPVLSDNEPLDAVQSDLLTSSLSKQ